jgi:acyl carrier protein
MVHAVRQVAARVLRLPEAGIRAGQPLGELGLDSLMGVELRNRLEAELATKLSATLAWNHPTVDDLSAYLLGRLGYDSAPDGGADGDTPVPVCGDGSFAALVAATGELDDAEAIAVLQRGGGR